jgi:hypothetical protein
VKALVVALAASLGVAGAAVAGDRAAVSVAERRVAEQVAHQGSLADPPVVEIRGFPFLTQAIEGTYREVHLSLTAADLRQPEGTSADVVLHRAHVPLSAVLSGSVASVPVDRIDGTATLSYPLLSGHVGGDTALRPEGDALRLTRTVKVLNRSLPVTGLGRVRLDGVDVVVDVQQVSGAGVALPGALVRTASSQLGLRYRLPPLPFGLAVTALHVTPGGLVADLAAQNAVLRG